MVITHPEVVVQQAPVVWHGLGMQDPDSVHSPAQLTSADWLHPADVQHEPVGGHIGGLQGCPGRYGVLGGHWPWGTTMHPVGRQQAPSWLVGQGFGAQVWLGRKRSPAGH